MRIEADGKKFMGKTELLIAQESHQNIQVNSHNYAEREAVTTAFIAWCKAFGKDPEKESIQEEK